MAHRIPEVATPVGRLNSINAEGRSLDALMDALEQRGGGGQRVFARWPFRIPSMPVRLTHPGGTQTEIRLACRNLSAGGASLLHNGFLYPDTPAALVLPRLNGPPVVVPGRVVRCRHVAGVIHELGIQFQRSIDLREHLAQDPEEPLYTLESVKPERLAGSLLHLEPDPAEGRILGQAFAQTSVRVRRAATAQACAAAVETEPPHVVVASCDPRALGVLRGLADQMPLRAVVLVGERLDASVVRALRSDGPPLRVDAFLRRPLDPAVALRTLADFLPDVEEEKAARNGGVRLDPAMAPRLRMDLISHAIDLEAAVRLDRPLEAFAACREIGSLAEKLGVQQLSADATALADRLAANPDLSGETQHARDLVALCRDA